MLAGRRTQAVPHDQHAARDRAQHEGEQQQRAGDAERADDDLLDGDLIRGLANDRHHEGVLLRLGLLHNSSVGWASGPGNAGRYRTPDATVVIFFRDS